MLCLLNNLLAVATVVYSTYAYMSFDQNTLMIWETMFYPSLTLILQTCVCHYSLTTTFPCILYNITDYERPRGVTITIYILIGVLIAVILKIFVLSMLYVDTIENNGMIVIYQMVSFLILLAVTVGFFADSLQYCSGWAYCDYLKLNNTEVEYAFLPFTLPDKEMDAYLNEKYIAKRPHTV